MPLQCTHCGKTEKLTDDHVFPTCLYVSHSNDRSIKVPSCSGGQCNGRSDEALLKSFMSMFDARFHNDVLPHLLNRKGGQGDLRKFAGLCDNEIKKCYIENTLTGIFRKMFMGLLRHIEKHEWRYRDSTQFHLFQIDQDMSGGQHMRLLPLAVAGVNQGYPVPPAFWDKNCEYRFRDFAFGMEDGLLVLKYNITDFGNQLYLACHVD